MWWKNKGNRKDSCFRQTAKMSCTGRKYRKGNKKFMKILALDSSGLVASVAVVENDTLLADTP